MIFPSSVSVVESLGVICYQFSKLFSFSSQRASQPLWDGGAMISENFFPRRLTKAFALLRFQTDLGRKLNHMNGALLSFEIKEGRTVKIRIMTA